MALIAFRPPSDGISDGRPCVRVTLKTLMELADIRDITLRSPSGIVRQASEISDA
jgi:hypothetical protein